MILLLLLGIVGFIGYNLFMLFRNFIMNTKLWFLVCFVIYGTCMGGVVYNILHNTPFTNIDNDGNFEWFHSGVK